MSNEVTVAFVKQFNANTIHLSQQRASRLVPNTRNETQASKAQFFERIGLVTATKRVSRHQDTVQIDTPHSRRQVTLSDFDHSDLVDEADKIRLLIDPASEYAKSFEMAFGRAMDDVLIEAASGDAFGGEEGTIAVPLGDAQKLVSLTGTALGFLNVQALRRIGTKFDTAEVDEADPRFCAYNAIQRESLLGQTEVTSSDFNVVKALVQGDIDTFVGLKFIRIQRLLLQASALLFDDVTGQVGGNQNVDSINATKVLAWSKMGLLFSRGKDMMTRITERNDKSHSTQVFTNMTIGATRMEEPKVIEIHCKAA